jgi:hypothetical protein
MVLAVLAYVKSQWPKLNFELAQNLILVRLTQMGEMNEILILPPSVLRRTTDIAG